MQINQQIVSQDAGPPIQVMSLQGAMDTTTEQQIEGAVDELLAQVSDATGPVKLVLDLTGVDYTSSSGLAVLLKTAKKVQQRQGRLALCGAQPHVDELLRLTRLNTMLTVVGTREEALAAVSAT